MIDWRDPDGRPERRITALTALRWGAAGIVVVAAHAGGVWLALNWKPAIAAGDPPAAAMLELAPLPVSPEAEPTSLPVGPEMAETQPEPIPDAPDKPEEQPEVIEIAEVKQPVEEAPPLPVPQPQVEIPKLPEKPEAEAVLTPPPPQPKQDKKPPPKLVDKKKPIDRNKPRVLQTTAPLTSTSPRADAAAAPSSSAASAPSMSSADWRGQLVAHLNRHKSFPAGASTGIVRVAFSIDRSGRVLSSRLVGSSGDPALDNEAVSLPRRSSPVPAPPANVGGGTVSLTVPIRFSR